MDAAIHRGTRALQDAPHFEWLVSVLSQSDVFGAVIENDAIANAVTQLLGNIRPDDCIKKIGKRFAR